jgi:hypothetical protein
MKVVEKDDAVRGLLIEESKRCLEMIGDLERSAKPLPKGSLHVRKKRYKRRVYSYFYLKYRKNGKVVNQHISKGEVKKIREGLALRKKYISEIKRFRNRINYINKALRLSGK